jgi:hypothetical protein
MRAIPVRFLGHGFAALAFGLGCGGDDAEPERDSTCEIGLRIHGQALADAIEMAPPCTDDADCIAMHEGASCPGVIDIDLCALAVHRLVPEYYDPEAVTRAMCEATKGAELGCSVQASCLDVGPPRCVAGECVFESAAR